MILVCQRVPLMLVYVYNGTPTNTDVCKGNPCVYAMHAVFSLGGLRLQENEHQGWIP